ncbi:hypothetical protein BTW10_14080 [Chromohalobacter japonicus]|uniref:DUF1468 domain-containing protein n=1 Tax=Chromohalobacter japonicus TaxID=223900 RepID=A0A1Q8T9Y6_9GAMM|nr:MULTISPECIES: tripartite tricarboxylate transporter TctB family protein [Chromohalobacter]OLO10482.1 hypothetical protein BTW10_14080 [Chromohalobacter japonicus]
MILRVNTDLAAGIFGLLFASLLWFPREEMGRLSLIFPRAILLITAVVSAVLVIKAFTSPAERQILIEGSPKRILLMILVLFAWWYLIGVLGFVTSTFVVFFGIVWYLASIEQRVSFNRILAWLPVAAIIVGLFYFAFTDILQVSLPEGLFF